MKVSVVIPVYNRPEELRRALNSVLAQTVADDLEVIVVDDCSEVDLNKEVVQPYHDNRIRFFRLEKKGYANVCRNKGILEAKGKYIAMLDSDDEWLPEHLEVRIALLDSGAADGLFGSHYVDNGKTRKPVISRARFTNESMADYLLTTGTAVTPTHIYKTECACAVLWDETLKRHQDFDFSIRFAEKFNFVNCSALTCIVHWEEGVRRTESFEAQMTFIKKHKSQISPRVYNQYHYKAFFQAAGSPGINESILNHYKQESYRFAQQVTLVEFLAVAGHGKSSFFRLWLRFRFSIILLLNL